MGNPGARPIRAVKLAFQQNFGRKADLIGKNYRAEQIRITCFLRREGRTYAPNGYGGRQV